VLRGPARRPAFLVVLVLALALLLRTALRGHWVAALVILAVVALSAAWDRVGPQRRAGRVRRSWPWH
jgi:hypothetical protein